MNFEVLINDSFLNLKIENSLTPADNKSVLSLINDFEDGKWRFDKFQKFIWNNIKETALSHSERQSLLDEGEDSVLTESAKKLRLVESVDAIGRGSEIAEIVLYGIMKNHYSALPIVPKIFYKQNKKDEAKGSDSVHIVVESKDTFSLWFGESKFYNSIENSRLDKIVDSVKDSISLEKIKKENSIITNLSDINDSINRLIKETKGYKIGKSGNPKARTSNHKKYDKMFLLCASSDKELISTLESHYNTKYIKDKKNDNKREGSAGVAVEVNGKYYLYLVTR